MTRPQEYRVHYYLTEFPDAQRVNETVWQQYLELRHDPGLRRTHYFNGRYENVNIPEERIPALKPILQMAILNVARYLGIPEAGLAAGFWVNDMGPGHVTLPHAHAEDDELASGVYYVRVPENSGELVLSQGPASTRISPRQGMLVLFPPDVLHEVTENKSDGIRMSIGMNFGIRQST